MSAGLLLNARLTVAAASLTSLQLRLPPERGPRAGTSTPAPYRGGPTPIASRHSMPLGGRALRAPQPFRPEPQAGVIGRRSPAGRRTPLSETGHRSREERLSG